MLASPRYPFVGWAIQGAPDDPGLYALFRQEEVLCVGIADGGPGRTIRSRLLALFEASGRVPVISHYQWEITTQAAIARKRYLEELGRALVDCDSLPLRYF